MSPLRKRPQCQKCGSPMAGHKRPQGLPVCPDKGSPSPERSSPTPISAFDFSRAGNWHWKNRNWVDPPRAPQVEPDRRSMNSWVTTEPAESAAGWARSGAQDKGDGEVDDGGSVSARSAVSVSSASTLKRTISEVLSKTSKPLASLFSTREEHLSTVTSSARRNGLYTGVVLSPTRHRGIKSEELDGASLARTAEPLGRQDSWWVVMGRDAGAVGYMLGLNEGGTRAARDQVAEELANAHEHGKVGTYPLDIRSIRMGFLDVIFAGVVGGMVVLLGLCML
ncbi:hypothetical protein B0H21DRAFT_731926 [Amylocystis lapponica]|nr:hypothetical protein B0H21DRAFT_731926 [Amylocystis lapponica]